MGKQLKMLVDLFQSSDMNMCLPLRAYVIQSIPVTTRISRLEQRKTQECLEL